MPHMIKSYGKKYISQIFATLITGKFDHILPEITLHKHETPCALWTKMFGGREIRRNIY